MDRVQLNLNYVNTKLQFELDNCVKRVDRLEEDDFYRNEEGFQRPSTKASDGKTLYIENEPAVGESG